MFGVWLTSVLLIATGTVIMLFATIRYHRMLLEFRKELYQMQKMRRMPQNFALVLLYIFIMGYLMATVDSIRNAAQPIYMLMGIIFFLGAVFVCLVVRIQGKMADLLRGKTLEVMSAFVNAIDMKDAYTRGHSQHVYHIVQLFYEYLDDSYKHMLNRAKLLDAAMLHDIGKISIKDEILNKQGKLSEQEWESIKTHPSNGKLMLEDTSFSDIGDWVLYHHERIDGTGYYALPGDKIPLEARVISIADTYSALCTDRVYRPRMSHQRAIEIMMQSTGTQFDPGLMNCFLKIEPEELEKLSQETPAR